MRLKNFALGTVLALLSGILAAEPDPVIGLPVFNNPAGAEVDQYAIFQQLARIVDRVPAGQDLEVSWYEFKTTNKPNIPLRLVKAHQRGVNVRIILDDNTKEDGSSNSVLYPYKTLAAELGTNDAASSYIVLCPDKKGCIGKRKIYTDTYAYYHNKLLIATKIVLNDGSSVSNVVFQSSGKLSAWDADTSYNNAITWSEAASFANCKKYFKDLHDNRVGSENSNYYWVRSTNDVFKTHIFPRLEANGDLNQASTDTLVTILNSVTCAYTGDYDDLRHQTDVRIVMWYFTRVAVAEKLAALVRDGGWVDIVHSNMNDAAKDALKNTGGKSMGLAECGVPWQGRNARPHRKYMLIDGAYDDNQIPRVFTGSHNYAVSSLQNPDDSLIRIRSADIHSAYLHQNSYKVRDTCSGKIQPSRRGGLRSR